MKMVFKLMVFSILLNFATGIMMQAIVDTNGNPVFNPSHRAGLPEYDSTYADGFTTNMNGSIRPSGTMEDQGNLIYRVLDMFNLGLIKTFIQTVDNYMFGFVNMMEGLLGGSMPASALIFGILKTMVSIGYMLGAFVLWTGKDLG